MHWQICPIVIDSSSRFLESYSWGQCARTDAMTSGNRTADSSDLYLDAEIEIH